MSSERVGAFGLFGLKVFGMSVNGMSVSFCARAGIAQSGTNASRLVAASPRLKVSLRLICSGMFVSQVTIDLGRTLLSWISSNVLPLIIQRRNNGCPRALVVW